MAASDVQRKLTAILITDVVGYSHLTDAVDCVMEAQPLLASLKLESDPLFTLGVDHVDQV